MRVLIVSASMGAGHGGVATELAQQLETGGHHSRRVDFLEALPKGWGRTMRSIYRFQLRYAPWTYDIMYRLRYRFPDLWGGVNSFYVRLSGRRLVEWVDECDADVVVSLYPLSSAVLGGLRQRGRLRVPVVTYITDFGVHPLWVHPGVDLHLGVHAACAVEAARQSGRQAAVCVPLVPRSALAADRRAAREWLGLADDDRMALVVAGSWGVGGISRTVSAVARCGYVPVTVCGRDERLRRRLVRLGVGIVIGWTDDMKRLMAAADVLVENAGGLTSMEAFAAGLPVVSYRPIAGHGRHNAREMDRAGVAHWARNSRSLADILNRLGSPGPERGLLTAQAGALFDGSRAVHLVESAASAPVPQSLHVLPPWMPSKAGGTPAHDHALAVPQPSSFADEAPGALAGAASGTGFTSSPAPRADTGQPVDGPYRPRHLGPHRPRRGTAVAAIVATIAALVGCGLLLTGHSERRRRHTRRVAIVQTAPSVAPAPPPVGSLEAAWVVGENRRVGSSAWRLSGVSGGASIEGYADHTSARVGQTVGLFVSTAASSYHVSAFRMGYYGGLGGRLVWSSPALSGLKQAGCGLRAETNMVECSWSVSVSVPVDGSWLPGAYLFKLSADGGQQSYVPLTVWDPSSHAAFVIQSSVLTWQAWNDYGGYSNFGGLSPPATGSGRAGGDRGFADRARVLSFDRPYAKSSGASDFLALELPLVSFAEQRGLDVTYWTDIDLSENPQLLVNHKALLSLGHNEFVTGPERQAEVDGLAQGVNLAFLGATPDLRPARLQASPLGPDREEVAYRDPLQDPLTRSDPKAATANTWAQPPLNKPASQVVGDTYGGYGINAALVVTAPTAWPFAGTGLGVGAQLQHVILGDYDNYQPGKDSPANVEILAHSPVHTSYGHHGTADMTYYTDPASHAGVFATGTIGWIPSLLACAPTTNPTDCPADAVATITTNVLHLFGTGPAGTTQPSTPNWKGYHT